MKDSLAHRGSRATERPAPPQRSGQSHMRNEGPFLIS